MQVSLSLSGLLVCGPFSVYTFPTREMAMNRPCPTGLSGEIGRWQAPGTDHIKQLVLYLPCRPMCSPSPSHPQVGSRSSTKPNTEEAWWSLQAPGTRQASPPTPPWLSCVDKSSDSPGQCGAQATPPEKGPAQTHSFLEQMAGTWFLPVYPPQPCLAETQTDLGGAYALGTVLSTRVRPGPDADAVGAPSLTSQVSSGMMNPAAQQQGQV